MIGARSGHSAVAPRDADCTEEAGRDMGDEVVATSTPGLETAPTTTIAAGGEDVSQLVGFRLGNEQYCVDIMHVQEIILIGQVTEMPQVPSHVRGLINLRGHVIPIIDLRSQFGLEPAADAETARIIVLNLGDRTLGITVDEVNQVLRIRRDQLEPAPAGFVGLGQDYVKALVNLEDRLLILLNTEQLAAQDDT